MTSIFQSIYSDFCDHSILLTDTIQTDLMAEYWSKISLLFHLDLFSKLKTGKLCSITCHRKNPSSSCYYFMNILWVHSLIHSNALQLKVLLRKISDSSISPNYCGCTKLYGLVEVNFSIVVLTSFLQTDMRCPLHFRSKRLEIRRTSFRRFKYGYTQLRNFFSHTFLELGLKEHTFAIMLQVDTGISDSVLNMIQSYTCCSRF